MIYRLLTPRGGRGWGVGTSAEGSKSRAMRGRIIAVQVNYSRRLLADA